jgi:KaiC/GvpD/RAD55 family RecA-like ATPase
LRVGRPRPASGRYDRRCLFGFPLAVVGKEPGVALFKRHDLGRHPIEQVTIVCDKHQRADKLQEALFQHFERGDVQIVGRLIKQQDVARLQHQARDQQRRLFAAGELPNRLLQLLGRKEETLGPAGHMHGPALADHRLPFARQRPSQRQAGIQERAVLMKAHHLQLRRLFRWLKDKQITAMITAERGESALTRYGLEEYVADCVVFLDQRVNDQQATRRLRVVKYRGSSHGTDEYPFLIDEGGVSVLPITSLGLEHQASSERVSTGLRQLDEMMGARGYFRGSSILVSGTAGTGKTSVAASFVESACERNEKCLWFAFEEGEKQLIRNMRSIGIDLQPYVDRKLLRFVAQRPTAYGLELHLVRMHKEIADFP